MEGKLNPEERGSETKGIKLRNPRKGELKETHGLREGGRMKRD